MAILGTSVKCSDRLKELNINIPVIKVKSLNRKYVECTRHVPQLLIRGDQIAVILLNPNQENQNAVDIKKDII